MRSTLARFGLAALASAGMVTAGASAWNETAASATPQPITLALITSLTGLAAPEFSKAPAGFLARIALQNAEGGVNGHKIVPLVIDDQTSPSSVATGVQDALSKGAFGIVSDSPLFFTAAKYPEQQGVPVTGGSFDGPEWGQQPYTNMFASDTGSVDPKYPVNTFLGQVLRLHGGTVVASYGYGISPSSSRSALGAVQSFVHAGGKQGVLDTSIPFGGVDFTTEALVAKQKGVDAVWSSMDNNSGFALLTALKQAGVRPKVVVFPTGYESDVIGTPAWNNVQGAYFFSEFRPFQLPNAATRQMQAALEKYQHFSPSDFPNFTQYHSWLGADLMIKGLQRAGSNPTRSGVIRALRNLTSYNGGGLLAQSINYKTIFGHDLPETCGWYLQAQSSGFVPATPPLVCGRDIPGTSTATS